MITSLFKDPRKEVKVKEAAQMNHIVSVVTEQIHEMQSLPAVYDSDLSDAQSSELKEKNKDAVLKNKLLQLVAILQQGGQFRGFNRKIQIRPLKWKEVKESEDWEVDEEEGFVPMDNMNFSNEDILHNRASSGTQETVESKLGKSPLLKSQIAAERDESFEYLGDEKTQESHNPLAAPIQNYFELRHGVERVIEESGCDIDNRETGQKGLKSSSCTINNAFLSGRFSVKE